MLETSSLVDNGGGHMEHGRPACAGGTSRRLTWSKPEACDHPGTRFFEFRASMLAMLAGNAGNAGYAGLAAFPCIHN